MTKKQIEQIEKTATKLHNLCAEAGAPCLINVEIEDKGLTALYGSGEDLVRNITISMARNEDFKNVILKSSKIYIGTKLMLDLDEN